MRKTLFLLILFFSCYHTLESDFDYSWESSIQAQSYLLKNTDKYNTNRVLVSENFHVYSNGAIDFELIQFAKNAEKAYSKLLNFFSLDELKIPTNQEKFEIIYDVGDIDISHAYRYGFIIYKRDFGTNIEVIQHELFHNFQFILTENTFDDHRWLYEGVAHIGASFSKDNIRTIADLNERKFFFENEMKKHIMEITLRDLLDGLKKYDNMVYHYYSLAHLLSKYIFDPNGFGLNQEDIKQMYILMADGHDHVSAINKLSGKNVLNLKNTMFSVLESYLMKKKEN